MNDESNDTKIWRESVKMNAKVCKDTLKTNEFMRGTLATIEEILRDIQRNISNSLDPINK